MPSFHLHASFFLFVLLLHLDFQSHIVCSSELWGQIVMSLSLASSVAPGLLCKGDVWASRYICGRSCCIGVLSIPLPGTLPRLASHDTIRYLLGFRHACSVRLPPAFRSFCIVVSFAFMVFCLGLLDVMCICCAAVQLLDSILASAISPLALVSSYTLPRGWALIGVQLSRGLHTVLLLLALSLA